MIGSVDLTGQIQAICYAAKSLLGWKSDIQEEDCDLETGMPFLEPFATHYHPGQIFTDRTIFRADSVCANAHC